MLVVVQLEKLKKRLIVPESFVFDLNEENLKNNGNNGHFTYLVYWSREALGDGSISPNQHCVPNFDAQASEIYPPDNGLTEACYKARLVHFCSKWYFYDRTFMLALK